MKSIKLFLIFLLPLAASGQITVNVPFLVNSASPVDTRMKVAAVADTSTIVFPYTGAITYITAKDSLYLKTATGWKPIGRVTWSTLAGIPSGFDDGIDNIYDPDTLTLASNSLSISGGNSVSLAGYLDNTDAQTLGSSYNTTTNELTVNITGGNSVTIDLSDLQDAGLTQEQIEDWAGAMVSGNTETGVSVTYDDITGKLNFTVDFTGYLNSLTAGTGISISGTGSSRTITNSAPDQTVSLTQGGIVSITGTYPSFTVSANEGDGLTTNEGSLGVSVSGTNSAGITSNTSGSGEVVLSGDTGISITENTTTKTITFLNTGDTNAGDDLTTSTTFAGDVAGTSSNLQLGTGVIINADIANSTIQTGKIQNGTILNEDLTSMASNTIKANPNAISGSPEDLLINTNSLVGRSSGNLRNITLGPGLEFSGNTIQTNINGLVIDSTILTDGTTIDFTETTANNWTAEVKDGSIGGIKITNGSIGNSDLSSMPGYTVKVREPGTTGVASDLSLTSNTILGRGTGNIVALGLGSGLSIVSGNLNYTEGDGSSINELQTLSIDYNTNLLSISGGNSIDISQLQTYFTSYTGGSFTAFMANIVPGTIFYNATTEELCYAYGTGVNDYDVIVYLSYYVSVADAAGWDQNASNDIINTSAAGGDLSGPFSNLQIIANSVGNAELATSSVSTLKIINDAVDNTKIANMNANTIKARNLATNGDPVDMAINTNSLVGRSSGDITNIPIGEDLTVDGAILALNLAFNDSPTIDFTKTPNNLTAQIKLNSIDSSFIKANGIRQFYYIPSVDSLRNFPGNYTKSVILMSYWEGLNYGGGLFTYYSYDYTGNGDDNGISFAAPNGGYWVRNDKSYKATYFGLVNQPDLPSIGKTHNSRELYKMTIAVPDNGSIELDNGFTYYHYNCLNFGYDNFKTVLIDGKNSILKRGTQIQDSIKSNSTTWVRVANPSLWDTFMYVAAFDGVDRMTYSAPITKINGDTLFVAIGAGNYSTGDIFTQNYQISFITNNVILKDVKLDGNKSQNTLYNYWGTSGEIYASGNNAMLSKISILNSPGEGILFFEDNLILNSFNIQNTNGNGIHLGSNSNHIIENGVIKNTNILARNGIYTLGHEGGAIAHSDGVHGGSVSNIQIDSALVAIADLNGRDDSLNHYDRIDARNCVRAVEFQQLSNGQTLRDLRLTNSRFYNCNEFSITSNVTGPVDSTQYARDIFIDNVQFYNTKLSLNARSFNVNLRNIYYSDDGTNEINITMSPHLLIDGFVKYGGGRIYVADCKRATIENFEIRETNDNSALHLNDALNVVIRNGSIYHKNAPSGFVGIYGQIGGEINNVFIDLKGSPTYGIFSNASTTQVATTIKDCTILTPSGVPSIRCYGGTEGAYFINNKVTEPISNVSNNFENGTINVTNDEVTYGTNATLSVISKIRDSSGSLGSASQALTNDGTGKLLWATISGASGVTSVTGTSPITSSGGTTPAIGITLNSATMENSSGLNAKSASAIWNANKLQSIGISSTTPTTGQVLKYNGTQWVPDADATGGAGSLTGSGTNTKIAKWTSSTNLTDSNISDDGTTITMGNAVGPILFNISTTGNHGVEYRRNGTVESTLQTAVFNSTYNGTLFTHNIDKDFGHVNTSLNGYYMNLGGRGTTTIGGEAGGIFFGKRALTTSTVSNLFTIDDDGSIGIGGITSPSRTLHVNGTLRMTGSAGTPTLLLGRDANGDFSNITIGSGLLFSAGTISNSGDTNASDDLTTGTSFSGDVSGLYNNLQLGIGVVGQSEIATDGVSSAEIAVDAVGSSEIAANSVGSSEMADNAIGASEIIDGSVGSAEITDASVANIDMATMNGNTIKANTGSGAATPTDMTVNTNSLVGRGATTLQNISLGTGLSITGSTLNVAIPSPKLDTFNVNSTWVKPANARMIEVIVIGGGGGGGSGAFNNLSVANNYATGGSGGSSGGRSEKTFEARHLPASVAVTVGQGGLGGTSLNTSTPTNGVFGNDGGETNFGTYLTAFGGQGGQGGLFGTSTTNITTSTSFGGAGMLSDGSVGGAGSSAAGSSCARPNYASNGGGGGGGSKWNGSTTAYGNGGSANTMAKFAFGNVNTSGGNGTTSSTPPQSGSLYGSYLNTGAGGGSYIASNVSWLGGANANANGAGGGGGGGICAGAAFQTGAGGKGANGKVIVITHF